MPSRKIRRVLVALFVGAVLGGTALAANAQIGCCQVTANTCIGPTVEAACQPAGGIGVFMVGETCNLFTGMCVAATAVPFLAPWQLVGFGVAIVLALAFVHRGLRSASSQ